MYGPGTLDQNMRRRSVYFFIKRSKLIPTMMLFDWPEHLVSIGSRSNTTIAPQALMLMNSKQGRACAEGLAKQLPSEANGATISNAYLRTVGRQATEEEIELSTAFLAGQEAAYVKAGKKNAAHLARVDLCQALLSMNEFVYVD